MTPTVLLPDAIIKIIEKELEGVDIDTFEFKNITLPNTTLGLTLVKQGTEKEKELDTKKGNLVGSFKFKEKEFFLFK